MKAVFTLASKIAPSVIFVDEVSLIVKSYYHFCCDIVCYGIFLKHSYISVATG